MKQQDLNATTRTPDAVPTELILQELSQSIHATVNKQYEVLNHAILPELQAQGIQFLSIPGSSGKTQGLDRGLFCQRSATGMTPISLDPSHPFPRLVNKSLNFIISLEGKDAFGREIEMAIVRGTHVPYPA